jgi:hypothetical protein
MEDGHEADNIILEKMLKLRCPKTKAEAKLTGL